MNLPFTTDEFLQVFTSYNNMVFPIQLVFNLLALFAVFSAIKKKNYTDKFISMLLGFLWLWIGIVYHLIFFSRINPAAKIFAFLFIVQGLLFIYSGMIRKQLSFSFRKDTSGVTGLVLIIYSLVIYPLLGIMFGHSYPQSPTFGLPCPTGIFTFGILIWTTKKIPIYILVIPVIWSVIGFSAAINLGIKEDIGLLIAGLTSTGILLFRKKVNNFINDDFASPKF